MNRIILSSLAATVVLALTACGNDRYAPPPPPAQNHAEHLQHPLASGVDFANFDKSVRPQDNFYRYVNGTWLKNTKIPGDRTSAGAFYDLREKSKNDVKAIINELANQHELKNGSDEQKVADLYRSFMDIATLNKLGVKPIQAQFSEINRLKNKSQLVGYFAKSQRKGSGTPMAFYVDIDAKKSSRYAPHIWQYGLSLPDKDYYFNKEQRFDKIRKAFVTHIAKMFKLAGLPNAAQAANTIMAVETDIASKHWDVVDNRDSTKTYNLYQTKDLKKLAPQINWDVYLHDLGLRNQKTIIINQPSYITGLGKVIAKHSMSDWRTYLTWQTLTNAASDLSQPIDKENFEFFAKTLDGQQQQQPRWKRGVSTVNGILGEIVGKVYVKRHFRPAAKERMEHLVENLRAAYSDSIDSLSWMSEQTKVAAQEKLSKFVPKIGYPDKWQDYSKLAIKHDDLIGNAMRASEFQFNKDLAKLGAPIDKSEWHMTPQTVNAYYNPTMNEIVFPAAILQPPFFNMDADDAVNYGGIGAVIGHEMGHGFDDQGAKFDGDGNLRDWWTPNDLAKFQRRAKALVKQYDGYYVFKDLHVNGQLTLGENIGDLSGLTIAYKAYKKSLDGKPAPIIDGLTGDQRFFIGFTQIWRGKKTEAAARNQVATDPHSPAEFRAIGSLSNMPEFYKTFDVKPGDKMFIPPNQRVKIW